MDGVVEKTWSLRARRPSGPEVLERPAGVNATNTMQCKVRDGYHSSRGARYRKGGSGNPWLGLVRAWPAAKRIGVGQERQRWAPTCDE